MSEGTLQAALVSRIRETGPLTVAAFMDAALYHPTLGYYSRAPQRSGRAGDFYTSVDVGSLFGQVLARLVVATWNALGQPARFQVVEAGAGSGRLARDILDALATAHPECYAAIAVTLVETSDVARAAQAPTLATHAGRVADAQPALPEAGIEGLLLANELLDAMPVHRVRMTASGLRELFVTETHGQLRLVEGALSTPRLADHFERLSMTLGEGAVADVSLAALDWTRTAARALSRGYVLLIDYGDLAQRLYGGISARGTLRAYRGHLVDAAPAADPWLLDPGEQDLTADVDFSTVEAVLADAGLRRLACVDQARFLLALGLGDDVASMNGRTTGAVLARLAARTLVDPAGLGGTHRALLVASRTAPDLAMPFDAPWRRL